jgi:hypothetical protein
MADPEVLKSIAALVAKDASNVALRLHLAELLLADGAAAEALSHAAIILGARPDDVQALSIAAKAADASGDAVKAEGYRRLATALGPATPTAPPPAADEAPRAITEGKSGSTPGRVALRLVEGNRVDAEPEPDVQSPAITLRDVAGMEAVKHRLNLAFLAPLRNPELRRTFGKSLRGGLLLYGPPGCGKTFIARATAGELGAKFMSVGIADVLDMWLGQSEQNLKGYFEGARRQAPCVLFFDEVDALGRKRSLMRHGAAAASRQFLAELDGMQTDNRGVFVLAATNHPWMSTRPCAGPGGSIACCWCCRRISPPVRPSCAQLPRSAGGIRCRPAGYCRPARRFLRADVAHLRGRRSWRSKSPVGAGGASDHPAHFSVR